MAVRKRRSDEKVRERGRSEIPIDMKIVDDLLTCGCKGTEIAAYFGIHADTLYNRVFQERGVIFSIYSAQKREKGFSLLKAQQFAKALGKTKEGDNLMLIWLGKNLLNQKENPDQQEYNTQMSEKFDAVMNLLNKYQSSDLKIADSNINNADKSILVTAEVKA